MLYATLESLKEQVGKPETKNSTTKAQQDSSAYTRDKFEKLQEKFDQFDMLGIENCLGEIRGGCVTEEEAELIQKLENAWQELEYEEGSELLRKYLER